MKLNMFRATHRPSSGAWNSTSSLWFCIIPWKVVERAVVGRCQVEYERVQWVAYAKNLNHRYQYRHYKERNTKRNPLRLQSYGFSLLVTKACPNCPHTHKFQPPRLFVFIICTSYNKKRKTDTFGFGFACVAKFSQLTVTMNAGKAHSKLLTLHATSIEERKWRHTVLYGYIHTCTGKCCCWHTCTSVQGVKPSASNPFVTDENRI